MCKKVFFLAFFFSVAGLIGDALAATCVWDGGGTGDGWATAANWSNDTVPTSNDWVYFGDWSINSAGPGVVDSMGFCGTLILGNRAEGSPAYVNVDGSLVAAGNLYMGLGAGSDGTLTINSGDSTSAGAIVVGENGTGTLTMNGGTLTSTWELIIGHLSGTGHVNIYGGILEVRSLVIGSQSGGTGTMDITEGVLVMRSDCVAIVNQYVTNGWIIAYGGSGIVDVVFDPATQYTTVSATPINPAFARNPEPADNEAGPEDNLKFVLSWLPGEGAESHNIYFGTDFNDVNNATILSNEYKGTQPLDSNSYSPATPDFGTYYWRIDEFDGVSILEGQVWSFTKTVNKPTIYHLNLTNLNGFTIEHQYDIKHVAACVQGLVNRDAPRVFLSFPLEVWGNNDDLFWLKRMREEGGLCYGWNVQEISSVELLVDKFVEYLDGVVLYDPDPDTGVISTSLVATTVSGVENGVAVRKDISPGSMYNYLVNDSNGPQLPVLFDLSGKFTGSGTIWQTSTPSTGSAKCDAYIWAKEKYIDTGKCNPTLLMYKLDMWGLKLGNSYPWQLGDLDYGVRNKGFCFELSPYGDQIPNDDPCQPMGTDRETFKTILNACNLQTGQTEMILSCGFPNWPVKYSNSAGGLYDGGHLEAKTVLLLSAYNAYMSADGGNFCNASFYAGLLPEFKNRRYVQNPAPTYDDMVSRGLIDSSGNVVAGNYIMIAHGDYDGAMGIIYRLAGQRYDDPVRGERYINWAINANEIERVSVAMDYIRRNQSAKDYFVAGDSGCGYVYPHKFYGSRTPSGYPDCIDIWQKHNTKYHRLLDYSITGWIHSGYLDGRLSITDCYTYAPFSGDGIVLNEDTPLSDWLANNMPYIICDKPWISTLEPDEVINYPSGVYFATYHLPFWYPSEMKYLEDEVIALGNNHRFLDAYTFFYLFRYHLGGNNNYRATWISDTIPQIMAAGQTYSIEATVRNDGWDTWSEALLYRLGYSVVPSGSAPSYSFSDIPSGVSVAPGQSVTFAFDIIAPLTEGSYDVYLDMVQEGQGWFRDKNNIEWKKEITVAVDEMVVDTDSDGCPDVREWNMGLLYWHPDDRIKADISCDGVVDIADLAMLSGYWLEEQENLAEDINSDFRVDLRDLAMVAIRWLVRYAQ